MEKSSGNIQKQKQHVDFYRKILLRKRLLGTFGKPGGAVYVPFCGDGDIADQCYRGMKIYGADLDTKRVEKASITIPSGKFMVGNCDEWCFSDVDSDFSICDFDSYAYPYASFRSFWDKANKKDKLLLFFTDGQKQTITRKSLLRPPDGSKTIRIEDPTERRKYHNFYFHRIVLPWFEAYIKPYKITNKAFYLRGFMVYWGAIIEKE